MSNAFLATGLLANQIQATVGSAVAKHGESIRNDSRQSPGYVEATRAVTRAFIDDMAHQVARQDSRGEVSEAQKNRVLATFAEAMGLKTSSDRVDAVRSDALFEGELIDRSGAIARVSPRVNALYDNLPIRSFDPAAQMVELRAVSDAGSAELYRPGTDKIPLTDTLAQSRLVRTHYIVTKTAANWVEIMYGSRTAIDKAAEDARAAVEVIKKGYEKILVNGAAGTDLTGIAGLGIPRRVSTVNYASPATSIEDVYEDFIAAKLFFDAENAWMGGVRNALFIGTKLYAAMLPKNNLGAGGSATGAMLFGSPMGPFSTGNVARGQMFSSLGIDYLIPTPSLDNFGGDPTKSAALFASIPAGPSGIRQLIGMAPAPVRSVDTLIGRETLFGMSFADPELPTTEGAGLFVGLVG